MTLSADSYQSSATLRVGNREVRVYRLSALKSAGLGDPSRLPYSIRVLLENLLRSEDGRTVTRNDIEAVAQWKADERPIDDVLPGALHDQRAYVVRDTFDEQWLRLIDADQALSGRTYNAATGSVVIEIVDPWIPANDGRWRISAEGASRDPSAPADLVAPIEAVSAAYLGGHRWWQLVSVGAVAVAEPAAVARADALFHSSPAPFCGSFF